MRARRFVTAVKHVEVVAFVGPNDGTEMMIRVARSQLPRLGESARGRVVGDPHRPCAAFVVVRLFRFAVVDNVKPPFDEDRLRPLPSVVEHLELATLTKRQNECVPPTHSWR